MMHVFCDTNILIYAYSTTEPHKADVANRVLFEQHSFVSTQVINELSNVCLRKFKLSSEQLLLALNGIERFTKISHLALAQHAKLYSYNLVIDCSTTIV